MVVNFRDLAQQGIGIYTQAQAKKCLNTYVDYYRPQDGEKHYGQVTKVHRTGYHIKDVKTSRTIRFKFFQGEAC